MDAVRRDGRDRAALNEPLMQLLLELDAMRAGEEAGPPTCRGDDRGAAVAEERLEDWSAAILLSWEEIEAELGREAGDGDGGEGRRRSVGGDDLWG